jgi:hypothetical protein
VPQGIAATAEPVTAFDSACMKNHHTGTSALWSLSAV